MTTDIKVDLSNRHVHLTQEDLQVLFGENAELTCKKMLGKQEFAANETVTVIGTSGEIKDVRVLGPCRSYTQVELLCGDCRKIGIDAPVIESVKAGEAGLVTIAGPAGNLERIKAAIIAHRHVHVNEEIGKKKLGLTDGQILKVKTGGVRGLVFDNVLVRLHKGPLCVVHLDLEEGNAAGLKNGDTVEIITE